MYTRIVKHQFEACALYASIVCCFYKHPFEPSPTLLKNDIENKKYEYVYYNLVYLYKCQSFRFHDACFAANTVNFGDHDSEIV